MVREQTGARRELSEVVSLSTPHKNKTTHRQLMISPTTLHDLSTASDKRTYLQSVLKQIVGSTQRKTALLKAGGVERYVQYPIMIREQYRPT